MAYPLRWPGGPDRCANGLDVITGLIHTIFTLYRGASRSHDQRTGSPVPFLSNRYGTETTAKPM